MKPRSEVRRVADALASSFTICPRSDYLKSYPHKSTAERMNKAWERTACNLNGAIIGFGKRERTR